MKESIIFLLIIIKVVGCGIENTKVKSVPSFDLSDFLHTVDIPLTEINAESISYIPLETCAEALIAQINRLEYLNSFFILSQAEIYRFDDEGKFICRIGKRGKGPSEYLLANDFAVCVESKLVLVLSFIERKIYMYSYNGDYIKTIDSPKFTTNVRCIKGFIFCYNKNIEGDLLDKFHIIDFDGQIVKSFPNYYSFKPIENPIILENEVSFSNNRGELFIKELYSDTVFHLNDFEMIPKYILSLGKSRIPPDFKESIRDFNDFDEVTKNYVIDRKLFVSKNFVYFEFDYKSQRYIYWGRENGSNLLSNRNSGIINDFDGGVDIWINGLRSDNSFISWVNTYQLKAHVASDAFKNSTPKYPEKKRELERLANSLSENDNPVLMIVKLKE
jgi:hypothetical protein